MQNFKAVLDLVPAINVLEEQGETVKIDLDTKETKETNTGDAVILNEKRDEIQYYFLFSKLYLT